MGCQSNAVKSWVDEMVELCAPDQIIWVDGSETEKDEEFLCYIWENRLLKGRLATTDGVEIEIVNAGYRNSNSGPDFLEAQIRIGTTLWAGNVEIHVKTSDWNRHQHQQDKAYGNVVLHVVYEHDSATPDLPTLVLNGHFDESLYDEYQSFIHAKGWIPIHI